MFDYVEFKRIVEEFNNLVQISEEVANIKISKERWSLKEIVGHLIDSASNNHQRFVRLQIGDLLDFPAYDGEKWIEIQKYNNLNWSDIRTLWYSYNYLLLKLVENVDETVIKNVWVKGEETLTLEKLINEYYNHIKWHMEHFENRLKEVNDKFR